MSAKSLRTAALVQEEVAKVGTNLNDTEAIAVARVVQNLVDTKVRDFERMTLNSRYGKVSRGKTVFMICNTKTGDVLNVYNNAERAEEECRKANVVYNRICLSDSVVRYYVKARSVI